MSETAPGAPRPRVLVFNLTEEEIEVVRPMAGSLRVTADINEVHSEEHDVLILVGAQFHNYRRGFPRRIVFAPKPDPMSAKPQVATTSGFWGAASPGEVTVARTQFKPARDFDITDFARREGIESLTRRSCLPDVNATYRGVYLPVTPERVSHSLIQERLERPLTLASVFETQPSDVERDSAIWLPDGAREYLKEWILFAFGYWRRTDPDDFPTTADWHRHSGWASPPEIEARRALSEFEAAEAERQRIADHQRQQLVEELEGAERHGKSWRGLLSQTGDELVASVKAALELLGFTVISSDELPEHKGKKREDLRVSDGDWTALVEVKGYGGAAKSNDLLQFPGAIATYAAAAGRSPDALWYVVNVYREDDPAQREDPLSGRKEDLVSFGEQHGCVIDTRELFALRQRVAATSTSAREARDQLKRSIGRYRVGDSRD